jgi:hypothetical protein
MVLVLILVSATAQMVSADPGTQTWYLSHIDDDSNKVMYKGSQSSSTGSVPILAGSSVIWVADQPAQWDVGFAAKDWTGHLNRTGQGAKFSLAIGVWDGILFTPNGGATGTFNGDDVSFTISAYVFDVPADQYLAFMITNTDTKSFNIRTNQLNDVSYPASTPDYPVPELATIILVSAGLLILAGYVYVGRRNK